MTWLKAFKLTIPAALGGTVGPVITVAMGHATWKTALIPLGVWLFAAVLFHELARFLNRAAR